MLEILFLWLLLCGITCYDLLSETFPSNDANNFQVLPTDESSGCKVIFTFESYYFYSDSCLSVPSGYEVKGFTVLLRSTKIEKIKSGDFQKWSHIFRLSVEMNSLLEDLEEGAFNNLTSLRNLSISNNENLQPLHPDIFKNLINLEELSFSNNNLKDLGSFIFTIRPEILPSLKKIDLSENDISHIKESDFKYLKGSKLESIYLKLCNIITIDPTSFSNLKHLTLLDFSNNNLNTFAVNPLLININKTAENFTYLSLAANLLHNDYLGLLKTFSYLRITHLIFKDNHVDFQSNSFPFMPNLEYLDLSSLKIVNLNNGILKQESFPKLKTLILSKNRMSGIMKGFLLPQITELDISENTCDTCFTVLLFKIPDFELQHMKSLKVLTLSRNYIYHIKRNMFYNMRNLSTLYLSNCTLYNIDSYAFETLTNLEYLDLSHNMLTKDFTLSSSVFTGLESLISLRLDFCSLTYLNDENVFSPLKKLKYLNLRNNAFVEFQPFVFSNIINLQILDISYNDLVEWNTRLFNDKNKLKSLSLVSNLIGIVTVNMFKDFSNVEFVDISENPFVCTCTALDMVKEYIYSIGKSDYYDLNYLHLNDTRNVCFSPRRLGSTELIDYLNYAKKNNDCVKDILLIIIIILTIIVVFILFGILLYYLRWHIRYWIFLFRQAMRFNYFPKKQNNSSDGKHEYDAFVSYSHEDRNFVVRLVAMLESQEPYFKLCVFERDFAVGGVITDNVVQCLSASRRTILVLSDSFARSTWCLWEMQMVQYKWLFFRDEANEPLIIIKIGEIMDRHMTPTLRYLIKTRIYLQWNPDPKKQKMFWQKLRSVLSRPIINHS